VDDTDALVPRRAFHLALELLAGSRGIVVNGPRQCGKTELLGMLHRHIGGTFVSLDDVQAREAARIDPTGFVSEVPYPLLIDEVQRGGDALVLAIKREMDRSRQKGRFVLAGSTRFVTEPRLSESLAGRVRFVDLWPLSQGELAHTPDESFADRCFDGPDGLRSLPVKPLPRREIFHRVCAGGFPEAVLTDSNRLRRAFFNDYVRTITQRDIRELGRISENADLSRLARLLAARTAGEIVLVDIARDIGVDHRTAGRFLGLLETLYLHHLVPAWSRNLTAKVVQRPKLHLVDSGLAAHLLGVDPANLARPVATHSGQLLETFVAGELARQLTWADNGARLHHFRDRSGIEVDLVLEQPDGRVTGIEVKAAAGVADDDLRGLRLIRDRLGTDFTAGVVLHCGERTDSFGDRLLALPVTALWSH
jgi:predicted AAA+ superfamily ATPase